MDIEREVTGHYHFAARRRKRRSNPITNREILYCTSLGRLGEVSIANIRGCVVVELNAASVDSLRIETRDV